MIDVRVARFMQPYERARALLVVNFYYVDINLQMSFILISNY